MPYKNLKEALDEHIFRKIKDAKSDAEASKILSEMERRLIKEEKVGKNEAAKIRNEAHKLYTKQKKKATLMIASELLEVAKLLS